MRTCVDPISYRDHIQGLARLILDPSLGNQLTPLLVYRPAGAVVMLAGVAPAPACPRIPACIPVCMPARMWPYVPAVCAPVCGSGLWTRRW